MALDVPQGVKGHAKVYNMSPAFVPHVFSGFVSSDEFEGLWTMSLLRYSFTPLSRRGWITAT